jgi:hypothetical protein
MFWIGQKIEEGTTLESLNQAGKLKIMFWEGGTQMNALENENPPSFTCQWLKVQKENGGQDLFVMGMNNQTTTPFYFVIQNENFTDAYDYETNKKPEV